MTKTKPAMPVHFRVEKSGPGKGNLLAVVLTKKAASTDDGPMLKAVRPTAPGSEYKTQETTESLSFVRLQTRVAKPDEYAPLMDLLKKRFPGSDILHYPKLTRAYLPKK